MLSTAQDRPRISTSLVVTDTEMSSGPTRGALSSLILPIRNENDWIMGGSSPMSEVEHHATLEDKHSEKDFNQQAEALISQWSDLSGGQRTLLKELSALVGHLANSLNLKLRETDIKADVKVAKAEDKKKRFETTEDENVAIRLLRRFLTKAIQITRSVTGTGSSSGESTDNDSSASQNT